MFALIKREIQDHIAYFIGAAVLSAILVALLIPAMYSDPVERPVFIGLSLPVILALIIGCAGMGVTQMYLDRTRKISALLSTLAVSRNRILLARIIAGILAILTVLLPLTVTAVVFRRLLLPPIPIYSGLIFDISVVAFLTGFACYCLGLQTGWTSNKITPTLGALLLTCVLVSLIPVKGFGLHIKAILVLFIVASLIRIWRKFMSTSL
jgi:TM2 domain-containing membrane protein YozV